MITWCQQACILFWYWLGYACFDLSFTHVSIPVPQSPVKAMFFVILTAIMIRMLSCSKNKFIC